MTAKERPVLVSSPLVRAYLEGRKTQTRRIIKPQPDDEHLGEPYWFIGGFRVRHLMANTPFGNNPLYCPYGVTGSRLWIREEHYVVGHWEIVPSVLTKRRQQPKWRFVGTDEVAFDPPTDFLISRCKENPGCDQWYKRLGRFMPRRFSRLTLNVTEIRVERLQGITEEDSKAEGVDCFEAMFRDYSSNSDWPGAMPGAWFRSAKPSFRTLWQSINGLDSWVENPWVWVVETKRIDQ